MTAEPRQGRTTISKAPRGVSVTVVRGQSSLREARFTRTFTVGSGSECDVQFAHGGVGKRHLQVVFDGVLWWVRDLSSGLGTYVNGALVQFVPLPESAEVELGRPGPLLRLASSTAARTGGEQEGDAAPERSTAPAAAGNPARRTDPAAPPSAEEGGQRFTSETQILNRYLRPGDGPVGRETMMFRRAFARVQKKSSRRYQIVLGAAVFVLLVAGGVIAYQARRLHALRSTAERIFYTGKALELETKRLEAIVLRSADPKQLAELKDRTARLKQMQQEYDAFVRDLGVYRKVADDERVILRVAKRLGECDVNMPKGFTAEVRRYVERWRATDRLANALRRARQGGYQPEIARALARANLAPQFLYLALQESGFDERAIGPRTRYGHAKGMWQFVAPTARRYGLRVGPLHEQAVYDPLDDRFDWRKATAAAASYIGELQVSEAQGSGLLAMASYNWGENNVQGIIESLPENPQDRNFWRLIADRKTPRETYDYVLSIFSAAVICEDPRLFRFDVECPPDGDGVASGGAPGAKGPL
jgi:soluble lytic murein transglycosylase-like protein/pSer/pThr/pTyr-binding forkhead associated (FHA) protein